MKYLAGFSLFFLALLVCALLLVGKRADFHFVPFLGQMSYFCSPEGVRYMIFHDSKTVVPSYDKNGHIIICINE